MKKRSQRGKKKGRRTKSRQRLLRKSIVARQKAVTGVLAAGRRWARSTACALEALLAPELAEGEEMPDVELLQKLFARALMRRWRRVLATDEARATAEARHERLLSEVECVTRRLYRETVDLRRLLNGVFGVEAAGRLLAFDGDTSRDPVVLLRQAGRAAARLGDPSRTLPPASFEPTARDRKRWAAAVRNAVKALRPLLKRSSLAGKEVDVTQAELRRAVADYDELFVGVAGWLAHNYLAAGHERRAAAVRPSRRRKGLRLEDDSRRGKTSSRPPEEPADGKRETPEQTAHEDPSAGRVLPFEAARMAG